MDCLARPRRFGAMKSSIAARSSRPPKRRRGASTERPAATNQAGVSRRPTLLNARSSAAAIVDEGVDQSERGHSLREVDRGAQRHRSPERLGEQRHPIDAAQRYRFDHARGEMGVAAMAGIGAQTVAQPQQAKALFQACGRTQQELARAVDARQVDQHRTAAAIRDDLREHRSMLSPRQSGSGAPARRTRSTPSAQAAKA